MFHLLCSFLLPSEGKCVYVCTCVCAYTYALLIGNFKYSHFHEKNFPDHQLHFFSQCGFVSWDEFLKSFLIRER